MFEMILLRAFQPVLKTSIAMIPFLAILLLLENKFRKQYSAVWKYSLFSLILVRLLIPVPTGKNENLTLFTLSDIILPKIEVTETTKIHSIPYEKEQKEIFDTTEIQSNEQENITTQQKEITMPQVPTIPQIQKIRNSFFPQKNSVALLTILAYIWFFVVIAKLLYLFVQYMLFYKKVMRWRTASKNTLEQYHSICDTMEIKKIPKLFVCTAITSPMCFGLFQKGIYIIKEEMPPQEMEMILKHELCHYKRKDLKYQLLCVLVSTIHFFNPFVTAFVKLTERDIELSCDDIVMENCSKEQRKQYSIMILSSINENISKNTVLSTDFVKEKEIMKKRFENILDTSPKKKGTLLLYLLVIICILSYMLSAFAEKQQLTLLFYLFNLFILFSFCFVISTKGNNKKTLCAMIALCFTVNILLVGCSQNMQNTADIPEQMQNNKKEYSDEEIESLLKWKTDYVGDNSAVGNILSVLGTPEGMERNRFEIQSNTEPYGITIYYDIVDFDKTQPYNGSGHGFNDSEIIVNDDVEFHFNKSFMVLFSLIKNLDYVEYHVSHENKEKMMFRVTRENTIYTGEAAALTDAVLEGYTDSVASYRYFLEYVDTLKTQGHIGYEQWQKEIDDALDEIIYNEKVALYSDVDSYIQNAPNNSYNAIVEKGEQALYYFLKRFEEGTAKGLRGQIMMRVCQEILGEKIGEIQITTPPAEEWYEKYQSEYHGIYPYYGTIVENEENSEFLIPRHMQQIFIGIEKAYGGRNIKILSSLLFYNSPEGIKHQYENALKINYYAKVKCYDFEILEQNKGNVLCLLNSNVLPIKIMFEQTEDTVLLKDIKVQFDEELETLCAEDKQMIPLLSPENEDGYSETFDDSLEQNLKDYVLQNNIDVQYYCIDGKTIKTF